MLLDLSPYILLVALLVWTILPTVQEHTFKEQRSALGKCLAIWAISSLPIFFGLGLSFSDDVDPSYIFTEISGSPFSWSEQLVYASTYLAPVIYAVAEALKVLSSDEVSAKKRRFKRIFRRYWRVFFPSLALLFLSIGVFSAIKVNPHAFQETIFFEYMSGKSILIYLVSWIYWYCIVLIDSSEGDDFASVTSERTQSLTDAARKRLGGNS